MSNECVKIFNHVHSLKKKSPLSDSAFHLRKRSTLRDGSTPAITTAPSSPAQLSWRLYPNEHATSLKSSDIQAFLVRKKEMKFSKEIEFVWVEGMIYWKSNILFRQKENWTASCLQLCCNSSCSQLTPIQKGFHCRAKLLQEQSFQLVQCCFWRDCVQVRNESEDTGLQARICKELKEFKGWAVDRCHRCTQNKEWKRLVRDQKKEKKIFFNTQRQKNMGTWGRAKRYCHEDSWQV